jgi:hypothetical protein
MCSGIGTEYRAPLSKLAFKDSNIAPSVRPLGHAKKLLCLGRWLLLIPSFNIFAVGLWGRRLWCPWRYRECQPGVPAFGPVLRSEFLVRFHVDVAVHVADREQKADLRTDAGDARPEPAKRRAGSGVVVDLPKVIADQAGMDFGLKRILGWRDERDGPKALRKAVTRSHGL